MNNDYNKLSYAEVLKDIGQFKKSGGKDGSEFNILDNPTHQFFKIMFHFYNGDAENNPLSGGLLAPSWLREDGQNNLDDASTLNSTDYTEWYYIKDDLNYYYDNNSAWSYLMMNGEYERASMIRNFVELLSNINTYSPWYFSSIEGLDAALERKQTMEENFNIPQERKKITIKCFPDSQDERIGTMLDLYKSAVWSWQMKREVVPANLRKFDMSLYVFSSPIANMISPSSMPYIVQSEDQCDAVFKYLSNEELINRNNGPHISSYKYIEFHNCEIDYNSIKTGYQTMDNVEGVTPTYSIDIYFDDCYESRYNEFLQKQIGDMVSIDSIFVNYNNSKLSCSYEDAKNNQINLDKLNLLNTEILERLDRYTNRNGIMSKAADEVVGGAKHELKGRINKLILGNLFGFSLTRLGTQVNNLLDGKVGATIGAVSSYTKGYKKVENDKKSDIQKAKMLGNIFNAKSMINNI